MRVRRHQGAAGMTYDGGELIATARSQVRRQLRRAGIPPTADRVDDLAMDAIKRAIESYDPARTDKGPIVLIRWKVLDVVTEAAKAANEGEILMDPATMAGVWA